MNPTKLVVALVLSLSTLAVADEAKSTPTVEEKAPELAEQVVKSIADLKAAHKSKDGATVQRGQKAGDQCLRVLSQLDSLKGVHGYDSGTTITTPEGALTLPAIEKTCTEILRSLIDREVEGCSTRELSVFQQYVGNGRWGSSSYGISEQPTTIDCKNMPKRERVVAAAASHKARFKSMCGRGTVVVESGWRPAFSSAGKTRSIGGTCFEKGKTKLAFRSMYLRRS